MFVYSDEKIFIHHTLDKRPLLKGFNDQPPHAHKNYEVLYFISGRARYLVEGNVYKLVPGCVMIMRSGEFHKIIVDDDLPYERIAIHFDSDLIDCVENGDMLLAPFLDRPLGVGNCFLPNEIRTSLIYECFKGIDKANENNKISRLSVVSNLFAILFEIKSAYECRTENELQIKDTLPLSGEIIEYINANLSSALSLEALAERFFVSKNHLNRIFKAATGVTVWEYIKLKRLILARNSIMSGSTAIDACQNSGFNDYSAFYRAYKEHFGVSPKKGNVIKE